MDGTERATTRGVRVRPRFFVVTSGLLLVMVLIGFAPSFFLRFFFDDPGMIPRLADEFRASSGQIGPGVQEMPLHVVAHGTLATAWMVLFFVQTVLISSGRRDIHRRLGVAGLFVAAGVFISGVAALILVIPRLIALADPADPSVVIGELLPSVTADFGTFSVFAIAVGAGVHFRRRPETHKQLMLLASMTLITPAIARIWVSSGLENALELWTPLTENAIAILIVGGLWRARRRAPWVLIGGLVFWFLLYGVLTGLGGTDAAHALALDLISGRGA